ncbi:hypothetical protein ACFQ2B_25975 [Streptomyces stramineus]|uniref:Uncharacterized protein n=1 Tax=Streptomyces stramineus TaxID=173861 RepID=A0ABN0ZQX8_9ACTN
MAEPGYHDKALMRIQAGVRLRKADEFLKSPEGEAHMFRVIFGAEAEPMIGERE